MASSEPQAVAPPAAAPPVEIRKTPTKGRSLVSTRTVNPGDTILVTTAPFLLPSLSHMGSVCTYCLRPDRPNPTSSGGSTLRACTRCQSARYCNADCQRTHWRAAHAKECKPLAEVHSAGRGGLPTPVRLLVQMLLGVGGAKVRGEVGQLESHVEAWRGGKQWADVEMMATAGCAYAGLETDEENIRMACEMMCRIQTNAFNWADPDMGQVAVFVEPTLAMINHSCMPNAMIQVIGRAIVLRAETTIQAGDEIEIAYTDYTRPRPARRQALETYNFECQCPRCVDDLNVYQACAALPAIDVNGMSVTPEVATVHTHPLVTRADKAEAARTLSEEATTKSDQASADASGSSTPQESVLRARYAACADLISEGLWAVSPVPQLVVDAAVYHADRGDWPSALATACLAARECDAYRYKPPFNPIRVKGLFLVAKLLSNTAAAGAGGDAGGSGVDRRLRETLQYIDQVSLCQMLLIMVLQLAPSAPDKGGSLASHWELTRDAYDLLQDIGQLPGREGEMGLIKSWAAKPRDAQSESFFKFAVVDPINSLSDLGAQVLKASFGG